jgi:hypothetical protein
MTPRSPQGYSSPHRERERDRMDRDEGKHYDPHGPPAQGNEVAIRSPPPDPFVRIKIMGLERNRRDIYIKFNAEVSLLVCLLLSRRAAYRHPPCLSPICLRSEAQLVRHHPFLYSLQRLSHKIFIPLLC